MTSQMGTNMSVLSADGKNWLTYPNLYITDNDTSGSSHSVTIGSEDAL